MKFSNVAIQRQDFREALAGFQRPPQPESFTAGASLFCTPGKNRQARKLFSKLFSENPDEIRNRGKIGLAAKNRNAYFETKISFSPYGAVAQLGERVNGIHEVEGSIPFSSTKFPRCY